MRRLGRTVFDSFPVAFLATVTIDGLMVLYGSAVIVAGALSGIAACCSVLFILFSMTAATRWKVIGMAARHGALLDILLTALLTYMGFTVSVTLGMTALVVGLNISGMLSVLRMFGSLNKALGPR